MSWHGELFTYKLEREKLKDNEVWEAQLQCGCRIQFSQRTQEEIKADGLKCPIHSDRVKGFISPIFQDIDVFRKIKLKVEVE